MKAAMKSVRKKTHRQPVLPFLQTLLVLIFLLGAAAQVGAVEGAELEELLFLPPDFYVGDRVELRAVLKPDPGMRILPPGELPVLGWIDLHDVQLERDGEKWEVRIVFTPFAPGTRAFPSIAMGDVLLSDIKLNVNSILQEKNPDFFGIKGQLYLPGTRLGIGILAALLFFGPVLAFSFTGRAARMLRRFLSVYAGRRPHKRLQKVLKELADQQLHMGSRKFYIILSEEFRRYLTARTGQDFLTITSSEVPEHLRQVFPGGKTEGIEELIRQSDMIKFGGVNAPGKQRAEDLDLVRETADRLELHIEEQRRETDRSVKSGKKSGRSAKQA